MALLAAARGKKKMKRIDVGLLAVAMAGSSFASLPALIPMPREEKLTGGSVALAEVHCAPLK